MTAEATTATALLRQDLGFSFKVSSSSPSAHSLMPEPLSAKTVQTGEFQCGYLEKIADLQMTELKIVNTELKSEEILVVLGTAYAMPTTMYISCCTLYCLRSACQ